MLDAKREITTTEYFMIQCSSSRETLQAHYGTNNSCRNIRYTQSRAFRLRFCTAEKHRFIQRNFFFFINLVLCSSRPMSSAGINRYDSHCKLQKRMSIFV